MNFIRVGISVLQTFLNYEEWRRSLHATHELQQQVGEQVQVYYERLLKLANCLQVKAINVFLTTIFRAGLQPYLRLTTTCMVRNTLMKHKEVVVICEEVDRS